MEPSPQMESRPSQVIETLIGFLIPPACREYVLGDLHERYENPGQYLADAALTVPLVIASRIRRTSDPVVLLMEGFTLYVSFLCAAMWMDRTLLYQDWGFPRIAIPPAIALLTLTLVDAYSRPEKRWPLKPMLGAVLAVAASFISQAVWTIPQSVMIPASGMGLLLLSTLRMLFPPVADRPQGVGGPAYWQNQELAPIKFPAAIAAIAALLYVVYELRK